MKDENRDARAAAKWLRELASRIDRGDQGLLFAVFVHEDNAEGDCGLYYQFGGPAGSLPHLSEAIVDLLEDEKLIALRPTRSHPS